VRAFEPTQLAATVLGSGRLNRPRPASTTEASLCTHLQVGDEHAFEFEGRGDSGVRRGAEHARHAAGHLLAVAALGGGGHHHARAGVVGGAGRRCHHEWIEPSPDPTVPNREPRSQNVKINRMYQSVRLWLSFLGLRTSGRA
jgi:hypothetical protein